MAVYVGSSVSSLTPIASNDEDPTSSYTSRLTFKAVAGTLYRIVVDGYTEDTPDNADVGTIELSLNLALPATNDNFTSSIQLKGNNVSTAVSNDGATKEPGEPAHAGNAGGKSVWWYWQAQTNGIVTVSTAGSLSSQSGSYLQALLAVYTGNSISNLVSVAADSGSSASVSFRADAGKVYRIAVDGYSYQNPSDADSGSISLTLSATLGLPLAPAWGPIPDLNGNMVWSTNFAGKVIVLNFWATWCSPCVGEMPDLVALYEKYVSDGLVVIGISLDSSPDGINPPTSLIASFVADHGVSYPVLTDSPSWWAIEGAYGGIQYIPTTFVIDRQNHICQRFVGSRSFATFEKAVLSALYPDLALKVVFSAGKARLSWPVTKATFIPESTTNILSGQWTTVTTQVQSNSTSQFIDLPAATGRCFYRLRSQ